MGIMTGAGSLSRVLGPVFVGSIYTRLGTNWTFGITSIMMALSMVWLLVYSNQLLPPSVADNNHPNGINGDNDREMISVKRHTTANDAEEEEDDQHKEKLLKSELEAKYINKTTS